MAADVEKLLVQIRADLKDLKQLQIELATVKKQGRETADSLTASLGNALGGIAKIFGTVKLKGIFDSAVADARSLEKTILGLQATARLTGNNFRELNGQVKDLAKDGVLSIDRASQSMKVLLAQGLSANKAFELVDAAKKVGAFNNIVGDTGQAVQDFIKFLQTGSAELAENLDPSLVKVVKSLGGYEKVANNAAAKQQLINAVIQKGKDLTADYAKFLDSGAQAQVNLDNATTKLSQTFGAKLAPAYNAIQNALAKLITLITDFVGSFDSSTVSIVAGTALIVVALQGVGGALRLLSVKAAAAWGIILGPLTLIVAAIGAVTLAVKALQDRFANTKGQDLLEERKALLDIQKKQELTIGQKERLKQLNDEIAKSYDPILKQLGLENRALEDQLRIVRAIDKARSRAKEGAEEGLKLETELRERIASREALLKAEGRRTDFSGFTDSMLLERTAKIDALAKALEEDKAALAAIEEKTGKPVSGGPTPSGAGKFVEARYIEVRDELQKSLSDFEKTIDVINKREAAALEKLANPERLRDALTGRLESKKEYEARVSKFRESDDFKAQRAAIERQAGQERADAAARQNEIFENGIARVRQSQAEFLEERADAEMSALQQQYNEQIANVYRLVNAKQISERQAEKQLQEIREANVRKAAKIQAESFARTLQSANTLVRGFADLVKAQDVGGGLSGLGGISQGLAGLSPKLAALGPVGQGLSAVGGIVSIFSGLFGKSEEERRREAEAQRLRDEEAKALLQLQVNYTKSMFELQEAQANLPFQALRRQLRLADLRQQQNILAGVDPAEAERINREERLALVQGTLTQEGGRISEGSLFAGTQATAEGLTTFLTEREREAPLIKAAESIVADVQNVSSINPNNLNFDLYTQARDRISALGLSQTLRDAYVEKLGGLLEQNIQRWVGSFRIQMPGDRELRDYWSGRIREIANSMNFNLGGDTGRVDRLLSETRIDTQRGEELLSLLEQQNQLQIDIKKSTAETAQNTRKLELLDPRKISFIDLVRNSIFSRGLNVDYGNVQLPSTVSATVLASTVSPVVPSDTLAAMKKMVELMDEANDYLAVIAENTNKNSTDDVDISDNRLVGRINNIRSRSIS